MEVIDFSVLYIGDFICRTYGEIALEVLGNYCFPKGFYLSLTYHTDV